jgi:hypothetical protein
MLLVEAENGLISDWLFAAAELRLARGLIALHMVGH